MTIVMIGCVNGTVTRRRGSKNVKKLHAIIYGRSLVMLEAEEGDACLDAAGGPEQVSQLPLVGYHVGDC